MGNTFDQCPVENIFYSNGRNEKTNYSNVVVRKVGKYDYSVLERMLFVWGHRGNTNQYIIIPVCKLCFQITPD